MPALRALPLEVEPTACRVMAPAEPPTEVVYFFNVPDGPLSLVRSQHRGKTPYEALRERLIQARLSGARANRTAMPSRYSYRFRLPASTNPTIASSRRS
jgi:hypothetical protein